MAAQRTQTQKNLMQSPKRKYSAIERELIRARTSEGRAWAKEAGKRMGRPHKLTPHQQREARRRRDQGESLSSIARSYNVHHATIGRLCG